MKKDFFILILIFLGVLNVGLYININAPAFKMVSSSYNSSYDTSSTKQDDFWDKPIENYEKKDVLFIKATSTSTSTPNYRQNRATTTATTTAKIIATTTKETRATTTPQFIVGTTTATSTASTSNPFIFGYATTSTSTATSSINKKPSFSKKILEKIIFWKNFQKPDGTPQEPTITKIQLPSNTLNNGYVSLLRFKITAPPQNDITIHKFNLKIATSSVSLKAINVYAFSDQWFSTPIYSQNSGGKISFDDITYIPPVEIEIPSSKANNAPNIIQIPAGASHYFEVIGTSFDVRTGSSISTQLKYNGQNLAEIVSR